MLKIKLVLARNENESLKRGVKDLQDSHQKLFTGRGQKKKEEGRQILTARPTISRDVQASLRLGEVSCQLRAKRYAYILPQLFTSISNYKVRTMRRDVKRLTKPE